MSSDNLYYLPADGFAGYEAIASMSQSHDMVMFVESKGTPVEGESKRPYEGDGNKKGIDLVGWHWGGTWPLDFATSKKSGNVKLDQLCVVKKIDLTTATFGKFFKANAQDLKISIAAYKAGGDGQIVRFIKLTFEEASMSSWQLFTSDKVGGFVETLAFSFRNCTIESAQQRSTGGSGPANTVDFVRSGGQ